MPWIASGRACAISAEAPLRNGLAPYRLARLESLLLLLGEGLLTHSGRIVGRNLGPLLEPGLDYPFQLGESGDEEQPGLAHGSIKAKKRAPRGDGALSGYLGRRDMCLCE